MKSLALASLLLAVSAFAASASSSVRVVDGDTLEVSGQKFRLHGIDAPEAGQKCRKLSGGTWACGKAAISRMEDLVLGKDVVCDERDHDDYGRTIGVCTANGVDVNAEMVKSGLAWSYRKYSTDYAPLEDKAHAAHIGVWQADTEAPWQYRAHKWEVAQQDSPNKCPIKGNISKKGEHIYHAPWSPWYDKTSINEKDGERWFCSEAEAIAAGWRAPFWGRSQP